MSSVAAATGATGTGLDALRALRRTRRRNRLGELEWFEALYRVYLAAFLGGGAFFFVAGFVEDSRVSPSTIADVSRLGPGWLGLAAVAAAALGLRSGSRGGPLSVEEADVRHVLLAPLGHRQALTRPVQQRLRSTAFTGGVVGAAAGQLASRRLPGSAASWVIAGALWGLLCGLLFVGTAMISHGLRLPRWVATVLAAALLAAHLVPLAAGDDVPGIGDGFGHLALLAMPDTSGAEWAGAVASAAVAVVVVAIGWALAGRQRLEALARRSALVAQLRFAVTMQDLRTVVLLRRQLSQEYLRPCPWFGASASVTRPRAKMPVWWRRSWRGLARFPVTRLLRIVLLAAGAAACQVAAYRGTSPAVVGSGVLAFILGLELIEPLSQEIDQADRASALPVARGVLHIRLLAVPAVAGLVVAAIGVGFAAAFEPRAGTLAVAPLLALCTVAAGLCGAAINAVSGAPDPLATSAGQNFMPPEVAGTTTIIKAAFPVAIATLGSLPILAVRSAVDAGDPPLGATIRTAIGIALLSGLIGYWVRQRDEIRAWWNSFVQGGRAASGPSS